jgi:hypothetical protein
MTPFAKARLSRRWAAVAALAILAVAGLESYALSQGIDGSALTAALTAIAGIGGAGFGRVLK